MDVLPPPGHIPVSVAAVYLIGQILAAETHLTGAKSDLPSFLARERPPFAILNPETPDPDPEEHDTIERFELTATRVEILKACPQADDLVSANAVRLFLTSKDGRPFYKRLGSGYPARDIVDVDVALRPPYRTCLHPARVRENLNKVGLRSLSRSKDEERFALVCPSSMAAAAGLALKQALADEIVAAAVVIEEDGTRSTVPPGFWRTERAEAALAQHALVSVAIESRVAVGYVFMSADVIRDGWAQILRFVRPKDPDHLFSPYIELAMAVSHNLGMVNGRDGIGARLPKERVLQEIERLWAEYMPKDLTRLEQRKSYVAALIRHPDDDTGGYVSGKPVEPKADAPPPKARRGARAGGIKRRKTA